MRIVISVLAIWVYMTGWYLIAKFKKRNDIADVAWGLGFILVTIINLFLVSSLKLFWSLILVGVWGIRLAVHIYNRNKKKKEDYRYEKLKEWAYLKVFMLQGVLMAMISLPIIYSEDRIQWFNFGGILIWIIGFVFESVADKQLADFLLDKTNKGKIMQSGLWAFSRHPNYFGEVVLWWGIWLLNLGSYWWTILGPLTITILILKVSGIPLLEKKYDGNQDFENYKKRVSVFIPWFPKK